MNRLRFEPAAITAVIGAGIALAITFGLHMTAQQEGLTMAVVAAVLGVVTAWGTTNAVLTALVTVAKAALALAVGYGAHLSSDQTGAILVFIPLVLGFFNRTQNSPKGGASAGVSLR